MYINLLITYFMWIIARRGWHSRSTGRINRSLQFLVTMVRLINAIGLIKRIEFLVVSFQIRMTKTQTLTITLQLY